MPISAPMEGMGVVSPTSQPLPGGPPVSTGGNGATSGAIIPNAGVYGQETAQAINAYNNAVATATARRNALYNSYGLDNSGAVDPRNPEGEYQQMLHQQANQFGADAENAAGRNLRGGLAHKAESSDRQDALAQDFQFQQKVAGAGTDFTSALQDALTGKQAGISNAYSDALNTAINEMMGNMSSGNYTAPGTGTTTAAPSAKAAKPAKAKVAHHAVSAAAARHAARVAARRHHRGG